MCAMLRHELGALRAGLEAALGEPGAATPEVLGSLRRLTQAVRVVARRAGGDGFGALFADAADGHAPTDALAVRDDAQRLLTTLQAQLAETDDRVLVVSHDVMLGELLSRPGRMVEVTDDRAVARQRLAHGELSALVLDLDLPAHDGRELLVDLHTLDTNRAPATLVLSSRGDLLTRTECTALGATFLRKPYPPGLVEATLEAALLRRRLAG